MQEQETEKIIKTIEQIIKDSYSENDAGEYILSQSQGQEIINLLWDILG